MLAIKRDSLPSAYKSNHMKKFSIIALLAITAGLFSISSCTKDPLIVPYNLGEFSLCFNNSAFIQYQDFAFPITKEDVKGAFQSAGVSFDPSKIENAKLTNLEGVITTTGAQFNTFASIEVYVREIGATGNGEQIAYTENLGDNNSIGVAFQVNGTQLKEWLQKEGFELHVRVLNKANNTPQTCLKLTAGIIKIEVAQ